MPVGIDQIKQLMLELTTDEEDSDDEPSSSQSRPSSSHSRRGVRGGASTAAAAAGAAHSSRGEGSRFSSANAERIDTRVTFLRRLHGGSLPVFDDSKPDPGCAFEVASYRQPLDPVFVKRSDRRLQVWQAAAASEGVLAGPHLCCRRLGLMPTQATSPQPHDQQQQQQRH